LLRVKDGSAYLERPSHLEVISLLDRPQDATQRLDVSARMERSV